MPWDDLLLPASLEVFGLESAAERELLARSPDRWAAALQALAEIAAGQAEAADAGLGVRIARGDEWRLVRGYVLARRAVLLADLPRPDDGLRFLLADLSGRLQRIALETDDAQTRDALMAVVDDLDARHSL